MQKLSKTLKDYCKAVNKSQEAVFFETAGDPAVTFVRLGPHTFEVWIAPNEEGQYIQSDTVVFNCVEEDYVLGEMKRVASNLLNTNQENLTIRQQRPRLKVYTSTQGDSTIHQDQRSVKHYNHHSTQSPKGTTTMSNENMNNQSSTPVDFNTAIEAGSGQPWRQQYDINTTQSTDITGWTTSTSLPADVACSQAIVTKNRVYLLGGLINSSFSSTVYTAPINTDGTLGSWTTGTSLPATVAQSQAIVTKNRVYLLGGITSNGSYSSTVYTATINSDGTLGAWTTSTSLPAAIGNSQAIVTKNRVYLLGGYIDRSYSGIVYTAPINPDGTLGAWTTSTSLPATVYYSQSIVTKNRVYLLGGVINGSYSSTVYTAPINTDGTLGSWTTGTSLPATVAQSQAIVTKNRVYLLGGITSNGSHSSTVYTAPINPDGTLGVWTTSTSLPGTVGYSQAIVTKNRVYVLGGYINSSHSSTVYTAPISGGLNDYSKLYDGSINKFDSSDISGTTFFKADPNPGNHQTPVEGLKYVGATNEELYQEFNDILVAHIAKITGVRFIRHSLDSDVHYHVIRPGVHMAGLVKEVINDKVVYWAETIVECKLKQLDTPQKDMSDWVKEKDLLIKILPLDPSKKTSERELDPVLEAALWVAPDSVIKRYIDWAEGFSEFRYPDSEETLDHLRSGL